MTSTTVLSDGFIRPLLPPRKRNCNKGDFGKLIVTGSCVGMSGAVIIACRAALRCGAGLVTAASCEQALLPLFSALPEATSLPLKENGNGKISGSTASFLAERINSSSALVLGCGLSVCDDTRFLVYSLIENVRVPSVIDADGINIVSENINILKSAAAPLILTPHLKEMSRLIHVPVEKIQQNKAEIASRFAEEYNLTLVLKDYETIIASPSGKVFENRGGHPCMAKGGSGDMLSGVIGALLAQGLSPLDAACAGVFIHARTGEICGEILGDRCVIASDLIECLPQAFKSIN